MRFCPILDWIAKSEYPMKTAASSDFPPAPEICPVDFGVMNSTPTMGSKCGSRQTPCGRAIGAVRAPPRLDSAIDVHEAMA
jgi:hypothetical protein